MEQIAVGRSAYCCFNSKRQFDILLVPGGSGTRKEVDNPVATLLAALYLIPALLVFGMDLTAGPTLLFETLPGLFGILPGGRLFGNLVDREKLDLPVND